MPRLGSRVTAPARTAPTAAPRPSCAAITTTLYIPLGLAALGIVIRGSGFAFRKVVVRVEQQRVTGASGVPVGYGVLVVVYGGLAVAVWWILRRLAGKPFPERPSATPEEVGVP